MYDTQKIAFRIKSIVKQNGYTLGTMLTDLNLGKNSISHLASGQEISFLTIAKIADYLEVSVDYLLGRTEVPTGYSNNINNIKTTVNSPQVSGNNTTFANPNQTISAEDMEMLQLIRSLSLVERAKMILFIDEMKNKELKNEKTKNKN